MTRALMAAAAWMMAAVCLAGAGEARLEGERKLLDRPTTETQFERMGQASGPGMVRIGPGGRRMLHVQSERAPVKEQATDKLKMRTIYRFVLRDVASGKDTRLPIPACPGREPVGFLMQMGMFDPAGGRMVLTYGPDEDGDGCGDYSGDPGMRAATYEIATGKLAPLDLRGGILVSSWNAAGDRVVVLNWDESSMEGKLLVSPVKQWAPEEASVVGLPRAFQPGGDLMLVLVIRGSGPEGAKEEDWRRVLYDLKKDRRVAPLPGSGSEESVLFRPHWTADGRYLAYVSTERETGEDGRAREKLVTRIWDCRKQQEARLLDGVVPVGRAPGASRLVMSHVDSAQQTMWGIQLYDAATGEAKELAGREVQAKDAAEGFVTYVKAPVDGRQPVFLARIRVPEAASKPADEPASKAAEAAGP